MKLESVLIGRSECLNKFKNRQTKSVASGRQEVMVVLTRVHKGGLRGNMVPTGDSETIESALFLEWLPVV